VSRRRPVARKQRRCSILLVVLAGLLSAFTFAACDTPVQSHFKQAVRLQEQGKLQEAIAEYDEALKLNPKQAEAYTNRGTAYANLGQPQRAIDDYTQAIVLNSKDALAFNNRGYTYLELRRYEVALADFNETIRLKKEFANAYLNRGIVLSLLGRQAEAQKDLDLVVKMGLDRTRVQAELDKFGVKQ